MPTNEISLNIAHDVVAEVNQSVAKRIHIPGTSSMFRHISAADLSDKSVLFQLLQGKVFRCMHTVKTFIMHCDSRQDLHWIQENICYPVAIKPATKDRLDRFSGVYPAKLAVARNSDELGLIIEQNVDLFHDTKIILQEVIYGDVISWCGYVANGGNDGYCIVPLVKSPAGNVGGTTTHAKLIETNPMIQSAVDEISSILRLDGIFEIEFIIQEDKLYFFYEINPRPILQVALLLAQERDIVTRYLISQGFTLSVFPMLPRKSRLWSSTWRYLSLNESSGFLLREFLLILCHDIYFGIYFSFLDKVKYIFVLVGLLFRLIFPRTKRSIV